MNLAIRWRLPDLTNLTNLTALRSNHQGQRMDTLSASSSICRRHVNRTSPSMALRFSTADSPGAGQRAGAASLTDAQVQTPTSPDAAPVGGNCHSAPSTTASRHRLVSGKTICHRKPQRSQNEE
ncbi:hypothetical protein LIA77_10183 [Sarocladium implicatum]|nr:hypothetical protein LIA77_10183 [Sarocladium implicatum]